LLKRQTDNENQNQKVMIIGDNNVFEIGAYSESLKIGDNNVIESKAKIGKDVIITTGCIIGAKCELNTSEILQDNTVIFGANKERRIANEKPQSQMAQLDFISKTLLSFQKFKKSNIK
jgi:dynactin-6